MKKLKLLIVEPGIRTHKEPIVKMLAKLKHVELYYACGLSETIGYKWAEPYCKGGFLFKYPNLTEATLAFLKSKDINLDGAITWVDTSVHHTNELQRALNLPIQTSLPGKSIRNKALVRQILKNAGIDDTYFAVIKTAKDIEQIPESRFPLILKPTEMMASLGVKIVKSRAEATQHLPQALNSDFIEENLRGLYGDISSEAILEEIHTGPGFSVETVVTAGKAHIIGLNKKFTSEIYDMGNCFAPANVSAKLRKSIQNLIEKSHKALQYENCVTHTELRVVKGVPKIIEINSRIGGDYIPLMIHKNGVDLGALLANTYTGQHTKGLDQISPKSVYASYLVTKDVGRLKIKRSPKDVTWYYGDGDLVFKNIGYEPIYLGHRLSKRAIPHPLDLKKYAVVEPALGLENNRLGVPILVALANKSDFKNILSIENAARPTEMAATKKVLQNRWNQNPERFVIAFDCISRRAVGFAFWVPATKEELRSQMPWDYFTKNKVLHRNDKKFPHRYIVSISIAVDAPIDTDKILVRTMT